MKSIVIAYEDRYCDQFHGLIKRLRRDRGQAGVILEAASVRGTGGFVNEVPKLLRLPLKQTKRPPDCVVCVADADRPTNLVPGANEAPIGRDKDALERWTLEFETAWLTHLVEKTNLPAEDATRLAAICIRWNKESLLIASPDALIDYASKRGQTLALAALLAKCAPSPIDLEDALFLVDYRRPDNCMDRVFQTIEGRNYKKGRDDEDLLRDQLGAHDERRAQVLRRCPDLNRLLDILA